MPEMNMTVFVEGTVYKVQRPMSGGKEWLIYSQDKSVNIVVPSTRHLRGLMGARYKVYVELVDGMLVKTEDQEPGW